MDKKLLVIYYHEIVDNGQGFSYQRMEKSRFEDQMRALRDRGYQTLLFSELERGLPKRAVIVSFDDGYRSVYENAAPIMQKYGIKGNVYLPTRYIGQNDRFMDWKMVRELCSSGAFEMQAHTHSHVDIRRLNQTEMLAEIGQNNLSIRAELGYEPCAFCMPYGAFDTASVRSLRSIGGYTYILGSWYGRVSEGRLSSMVLPRIGISNDDSLEKFIAKLEGRYDWKGPLQKLRLYLQSARKEYITEFQY